MSDPVDDLMDRLCCLSDANEELTASQLRHEATALQLCLPLASSSDIIEILQMLLKLLAGQSLRTSSRDGARYCAWISSSEGDRNDFMVTVNYIAAELCTSYTLEEAPIAETTKRIIANDFLGLGCMRNLCIVSKINYECSSRELHHLGMLDLAFTSPLINFLNSLELYVFKTMDKIVSIISTTEMYESVESTIQKMAVEDCELLYYSHVFQTTGEVSVFLATINCGFYNPWINLWRKVYRTSNMEYLFFRASNLTCNCGKSVDPGSTCVIMDNCYDLICEQCARIALPVPQNLRMCPVCKTSTKHWMSSNVFEKLKTKMKKRKEYVLLS